MSDLIIKNAIISSADIVIEEYGFLGAWLYLDFDGSGQGFGGYNLYSPSSSKHHKLETVAGHFIYRILEIAGVDKWNKLKGKTVRVKGTHSGIEAMGHIVKDDWFCPSKDFLPLKKKIEE